MLVDAAHFSPAVYCLCINLPQSISLVLEPDITPQFSCIFASSLGINICIFLCVSCVAGSRSGSPGRVLTTTALSTVSSGAQRVLVNSASAQKRSKIPRSQGCSREASPSRLSVGKTFCVSATFDFLESSRRIKV